MRAAEVVSVVLYRRWVLIIGDLQMLDGDVDRDWRVRASGEGQRWLERGRARGGKASSLNNGLSTRLMGFQ